MVDEDLALSCILPGIVKTKYLGLGLIIYRCFSTKMGVMALLVLYKLVDDITDRKRRKRRNDTDEWSGGAKLYMIHSLVA